MSYSEQLTQSRSRLHGESLLFLRQTRTAGAAFATETTAATVAFVDRMAEATTALAAAFGDSASALGRAWRTEALDWADLTIKTRDAYTAALTARFEALEAKAEQAQQVLEPTALEGRVLKATHEALGDAQKRVEARLTRGSADEARKPAAKARPATKKTGRAPIRNYDQLTAKDVVGRLQRLSGAQATAILDYEQAGKKRATVIRAAKQRVAAS